MKKTKVISLISLIVGFLYSYSPVYSAGLAQVELMNAILNSDQSKIQQIFEDPQQKEQIDLKEQMENGWNPLSLASAKGNKETVQFLLDKGADPAQGIIYDRKQITPFFLAAQGNHTETMQLIMNSPRFDYVKEIRTALAQGDMALVDQLILVHASHPELPKTEELAEVYRSNPILHSLATLFSSTCAICGEALGYNGKVKLIDGSDRLADIALTECGHCYCKACLDQWQKIGKTCPTCRYSLSANKTYYVKSGIPRYRSKSRKVTIPSHFELRQIGQPVDQVTQGLPSIDIAIATPFTEVNDRPDLIPFLGEQMWQKGNLIMGDVVKKPNGSIHYMTHKQAQKYCNSLAIKEVWWRQWWPSWERSRGARLPSRREFQGWARDLGRGSPAGYLPHILPNLEGYVYWSSTRDPSDTSYSAYSFNGNNGNVNSENRSLRRAVRCVVLAE